MQWLCSFNPMFHNDSNSLYLFSLTSLPPASIQSNDNTGRTKLNYDGIREEELRLL